MCWAYAWSRGSAMGRRLCLVSRMRGRHAALAHAACQGAPRQRSDLLQYLGCVCGEALASRRQGECRRQPSRSYTRQQAPVRRQAGRPRAGIGRLAAALLPCRGAGGTLRAVPLPPPAAAERAGCCRRCGQQHLRLRRRHEHIVLVVLQPACLPSQDEGNVG